MKKVLFLHVPKTSGTSLKLFFKDVLDDFFVQANSARQLEQSEMPSSDRCGTSMTSFAS